MHEITLQTVLEEKYNIHEKFYTESKFVAASDFDCNIAELVGVGISKRCIVVAKVKLSEDDIDYDLMSLIPVSLCRLEIKSRNSFLLSGPNNPPRHFLLCSSENMESIWNSFVRVINTINKRFKRDLAGWKTVELQAPESFDQNCNQNCPVTCGVSASANISFFHYQRELGNPLYDKGNCHKNSASYHIESVGHELCPESPVFDNFINDADALREAEIQERCNIKRSKERSGKPKNKSLFSALYNFFYRS